MLYIIVYSLAVCIWIITYRCGVENRGAAYFASFDIISVLCMCMSVWSVLMVDFVKNLACNVCAVFFFVNVLLPLKEFGFTFFFSSFFLPIPYWLFHIAVIFQQMVFDLKTFIFQNRTQETNLARERERGRQWKKNMYRNDNSV